MYVASSTSSSTTLFTAEPVSLFDHVPVTDRVLVFRTSVKAMLEVEQLRDGLDGLAGPRGRWSFDLEDRDRVLRVEGRHLDRDAVLNLLKRFGHECAELV